MKENADAELEFNKLHNNLSKVNYPGVYKVPYNFIFFPAHIFLNLDFLPQHFCSLPLFPLYYREDVIVSPFPFSTSYSSPQPWHSLPLIPTWYTFPKDPNVHKGIRNFIPPETISWVVRSINLEKGKVVNREYR